MLVFPGLPELLTLLSTAFHFKMVLITCSGRLALQEAQIR
jgi:hypothetical protein